MGYAVLGYLGLRAERASRAKDGRWATTGKSVLLCSPSTYLYLFFNTVSMQHAAFSLIHPIDTYHSTDSSLRSDGSSHFRGA